VEQEFFFYFSQRKWHHVLINYPLTGNNPDLMQSSEVGAVGTFLLEQEADFAIFF